MINPCIPESIHQLNIFQLLAKMWQVYSSCVNYVTVKSIITRKRFYPMFQDKRLHLMVRCAHINAKCFRLVTPGNNTTIVVRKNHYRYTVESRIKDSRTGCIKLLPSISANTEKHLKIHWLQPLLLPKSRLPCLPTKQCLENRGLLLVTRFAAFRGVKTLRYIH